MLGQAGARFAFDETVVYIDPYLTDSVAEQYGDAFRRLIPPSVCPGAVRDASWVLITHAHEDHADPSTLEPLARASSAARFMCPPPVVQVLRRAGVAAHRIIPAMEEWYAIGPGVSVRAVPAAHLTIERDSDGAPSFVGYLLKTDDRTIYHSGDTIPHPDVIASVRREGGVDYALLPVNERNYYRDALGIVGNMSVREALLMADDISARTLIPIHWDLFAPNGTPRAEIALVHELTRSSVGLMLCDAGRTERLW
jgi:L-ascorbate metabolism protein UlaG (beta-lactamase superfamily)